MIDHDELRQYLRANLRLNKESHSGYYGEKSVTVELVLDDKVISEVTIDMPSESRWQSSSC